MKPIVQQILLPPNSSFVTERLSSLINEKNLHQHDAYQLTIFTNGSGHATIGDHKVNYDPGDIFFLGSNLPHQFQINDGITSSAIIVYFTSDFLGKEFLHLPECRNIRQLIETSTYGIQITGNTKYELQPLMQSLETATEANRIILLLQCLQIIASAKESKTLNAQQLNKKDQDFLYRIFKYTNDTFHEPVTLPKIAAVACMSVQTFCSHFKRHTRKTYITYLNEVRVQHACYQLLQTNKPVIDIGYESGYNTVAHFHRQFLRLKKITPLQYRKKKTWK